MSFAQLSRRSGALLALLALCSLAAGSLADDTKAPTIEEIQKHDDCIYKAVYSFADPSYYPPSTPSELNTTCANQKYAFKCLKEQTKGLPSIARRGVLTLVSTRQRSHKKLCTSMQSDYSKQFLAGIKCLRDNSLSDVKAADSEYITSMAAILQNNYNDSKIELKHICCSLIKLRKNILGVGAKNCASHQPVIEDMVTAIVPSDISLLCEDEEKLEKICPTLEPLRYQSKPGEVIKSGVSMTLYLVSTLGEADVAKPEPKAS